MIKSDLIAKLTKKYKKLTEKESAAAVKFILNYLGQALSKGKRIELRRFGSFSLHYRPPRNAHNPKTGSKVITQGKYTPHFKPGKDLKARVNNSKDTTPILKEEKE